MQTKSLSCAVAGLLLVAGGIAVHAQPYSNAVMSLNPAGYWPLNESIQPPQPINLTAHNLGTLGTAGNGNYGAWYQPSGNTWYLTNNTVLTNGATVDGDTALNCQFAPGQYIVLPRNSGGVPNTNLTIKPPFSIEAWVNPGTTAARLGGIVSEGEVQLLAGGPNTNNPFYGGSGTGTVWAGFALGQYQNFFFFSCFNTNAFNNKSSELDSPHTLVVGQWVHLVVTFDGTHEVMYMNGAQVASKTVAANAAGQTYVPDPTSPLMIGSGSDVAVDYGVSFTGGLDEVAIYNSILPLSSIQNHYQTAFGTNATFGNNYTNSVLADSPTIYFRMDDAPGVTNIGYPSGTFPVANNYGSTGSAGNGVYQPGTIPGVPGPAFTGFGSGSTAVAMNGWLGAVDIGSSNIPAALNPTGIAPLTIATWFKTGPADSPGRFQNILGHSDNSYRMGLGQVAGENHFNAGPGPELQFTTAADVATNGFAFNDGQWHMIAGVTDGTNEYLYLDGVLAKSGSNAAGINIVGSTRDLLLGGDPQYTAASDNTPNTIKTFDGEIAQAAFWTNALTGAQIQGLFNAAGVTPYFWLQPVSLTTNANQNVTIVTGVRGSNPISYQWYQNGSPASGQTNANLVFTPITTANAGSYYLVASNTAGATTSSVINLTVFGPPTIVQQTPTQLEIFTGSSPVLHATVTGATPITYQWSSNSTTIPGATNSSYTVANAHATATYTCFISNSVGTASISPIALNILSDPTAPYPSKVLGDTPSAYFRLDENSGSPTAFDYVGGNNGAYSNVTLGVSGYDSLNAVQSDPTETAAEFGDFPPNNDFAGNVPTYLNFGTPNGGNGQFSVEAWVTQYFYQGGGDCIAEIGFGNGGEQFVLDTGNGASGAVRFFVRNAAGTVSGASSTNVIANDGKWHHVVGVCDQAGGHVYIYIDGAQAGNAAITAGSGILSSSMPLTIGARESGNFSPVTNDFQFLGKIDDVAIYPYALTANQIQAHYFATGFAPTSVQVSPSSTTNNQGSSVTFTATAQGTAPFGYQWSDPNNNPISGQTNSTLTLNNLQQSQSGNYSVTVSNAYGSASASATLTVVLGPPQITQDITPSSVTAFATDPVTLYVVVSGSQPLTYQWFRDGSAVAGANGSSYTFPAILGTNTYFVTVTNAFSSGPTTSGTATVIGEPITTLNPSNYSSSLKITFAGYNRSETLSNFPALVRLSTAISGFSYAEFASPTGGDLRFTDAGGTREIPYEVDQWNDSNGVSSIWVQVPKLSGTNDFIWAYWGNAGDTTPPAFTTNGSVWVPPAFENLPAYDVVYHLKESTFPYADGTLAYPALTGVAPAPVPGIIGTAEAFDGAMTFLDAGLVTNLNDVFTLSAWVNVSTSASTISTIWANQKGGFGSAGFSFFVNFYQTSDQELLLDTGDGTTGHETATAPNLVTFGQWHLVDAAINRTNGTVAFYVDGAPQGGGAVTTDFTNVADLNLGRFTNSSLYFLGAIDEARIHAGIESSNWVWATWMNVASNSVFQNYAAVGGAAPPVRITVARAPGSVVLTWPQGTLQSAPNAIGTYTNVPGATSPYTNPVTSTRQFYRVKVQ